MEFSLCRRITPSCLADRPKSANSWGLRVCSSGNWQPRTMQQRPMTRKLLDRANGSISQPMVSASSKISNPTIDVEPGRNKLTSLMVLGFALAATLETEQWRYELLASTSASNVGWPVNKLEFPPEEARRGNRKGSSVETPQSKSSIMVPGKYWQEMRAAFEARLGQTNEWTIPIPEALAQAVRDALKSKKSTTN